MSHDRTVFGRMATWVLTANQADWDAVFEEQLPRVHNFFRYRVGPGAVAEDLTSITFEKAWQARDRYRRDLGAFTTWLFTIARNVAIDHYRRQRHHAPLEAALDVADAGSASDRAEHHSNLSRLAHLLAGLEERERELIALKYGASMTNRAIARATGLSESNVGTILHRTIQALRADWEGAQSARLETLPAARATESVPAAGPSVAGRPGRTDASALQL